MIVNLTDPIELIPSEGMGLVNDEGIYSNGPVYLGKFDSPDNWSEIPLEDIPKEESEPDFLPEGIDIPMM